MYKSNKRRKIRKESTGGHLKKWFNECCRVCRNVLSETKAYLVEYFLNHSFHTFMKSHEYVPVVWFQLFLRQDLLYWVSPATEGSAVIFKGGLPLHLYSWDLIQCLKLFSVEIEIMAYSIWQLSKVRKYSLSFWPNFNSFFHFNVPRSLA